MKRSPLTNERAVVGALHHVKGQLLVCRQDVEENVGCARERSRVSCHRSPQQHDFYSAEWV